MSSQTTETPGQSRSSNSRRWWALSVLALAQFLVVLDASIVNIALPVIGNDLGMDNSALAWVITAYVLGFGGLLLLGGRLADRFGHRRVFLVGVAGFTAASTLAALSVSTPMLLAARSLQGVSAALLAPAALALVTQIFTEPRVRAKALGIWGAVAGIGSAAGVLLGGVLTSAFGWASVFLVNVPVGVLIWASLPGLLKRGAEPHDNRNLDAPGALTVTAALVSLVGALSAAEQIGILHPMTVILGAASIVLVVTFILLERRSAAPLVPLDIFRRRNLRAGNIVMLLVGASTVALFYALSVYMQAVLGYDAYTAGISQLPLAGALVTVAGIVPALISRIGAKYSLVASLLLLTAGLLWLAAAPYDASFIVHLLGPTLLIGVGLGGAFVTGTHLAVSDVDGSESGLAGGLVNTSQQIGGAIGLASLASLAALRTSDMSQAGAAPAEALTSGFSWLFIGAALTSLGAIIVAFTARSGRD